VAYFFDDREDAEEVRRRLASDGIDAEVRRERFHGEDDDEEHPWTVVTTDPAAAGSWRNWPSPTTAGWTRLSRCEP